MDGYELVKPMDVQGPGYGNAMERQCPHSCWSCPTMSSTMVLSWMSLDESERRVPSQHAPFTTLRSPLVPTKMVPVFVSPNGDVIMPRCDVFHLQRDLTSPGADRGGCDRDRSKPRSLPEAAFWPVGCPSPVQRDRLKRVDPPHGEKSAL